MTAGEGEFPPFRKASKALRLTTECLARELSDPSGEAPDWCEFEWATATAVAAMQGIAVLLANRLRWTGPDTWERFLAEQERQSRLNFDKIGRLLERLDDELRKVGCPAVALKGAAIRGLGIYQPGERPMGDIDLLIRDDDIPLADRALRRLHYERFYESRRHVVYAPNGSREPQSFGEHVGNPLKIEVHTRIAEPLPVSEVDVTDLIWGGVDQSGLNSYPGLSELTVHILLHAAGSIRVRTARLLQFMDVASLGSQLTDERWNHVLSDDWGEPRWWLYPPLAMAERYLPGCVPATALESARELCPRWLRFAADRRTLTDVSWSNLNIYAFPGISWSRTPSEAIRYFRRRVWAPREALQNRAQAIQVNPRYRAIPWHDVAQGRRVLRWLLKRPPRVETMLSLRWAIESARSAARG